MSDPFLFSGMEQDVTGLYYSGGRYQSPRLSRSISEIGPQTGGGSGGGTTGRASGPSGGSGSGGGSLSFGETLGQNAANNAARTAIANAAGFAAQAAAQATVALLNALIPELGLSVPAIGLPVAAATLILEDVLGTDFFNFSGTPWMNPKRYEPGHPIQWSLLGLDGELNSGQERGYLTVQFHGYNYCGPGNNGGPTTLGTLDACCRQHDDCYDQNHLSKNNVLPGHPGAGAGSAQRRCDQALCDCMRSATPAGWADSFLRYFAGGQFCY